MSADSTILRPLAHDAGVDLLEFYRLKTEIKDAIIIHESIISDPARGLRKRRVRELWTRKGEIGQGGFGTVWLEEEKTGTLRAVKTIRKSYTLDQGIDYLRELLSMAVLSRDTPSFPKLQGWFDDGPNLCIAMEYFKHGDLSQYVKDPLREPDAQSICSQLGEALSLLHDRGITHRDLKPSNVFVVRGSPDWWVKLGDFGIAKRVQANDTGLRTRVLSPEYAAPEVMEIVDISEDEDEESVTYTSAVDIWSLGCIAHWLLTLQPPFKNFRHVQRYCFKKITLPVERLEEASISAEGIDFFRTCLSPKPTERPTARQLFETLWLQDLDPELNDGRSHASTVSGRNSIDAEADAPSVKEYINTGSEATMVYHSGSDGFDPLPVPAADSSTPPSVEAEGDEDLGEVHEGLQGAKHINQQELGMGEPSAQLRTAQHQTMPVDLPLENSTCADLPTKMVPKMQAGTESPQFTMQSRSPSVPAPPVDKVSSVDSASDTTSETDMSFLPETGKAAVATSTQGPEIQEEVTSNRQPDKQSENIANNTQHTGDTNGIADLNMRAQKAGPQPLLVESSTTTARPASYAQLSEALSGVEMSFTPTGNPVPTSLPGENDAKEIESGARERTMATLNDEAIEAVKAETYTAAMDSLGRPNELEDGPDHPAMRTPESSKATPSIEAESLTQPVFSNRVPTKELNKLKLFWEGQNSTSNPTQSGSNIATAVSSGADTTAISKQRTESNDSSAVGRNSTNTSNGGQPSKSTTASSNSADGLSLAPKTQSFNIEVPRRANGEQSKRFNLIDIISEPATPALPARAAQESLAKPKESSHSTHKSLWSRLRGKKSAKDDVSHQDPAQPHPELAVREMPELGVKTASVPLSVVFGEALEKSIRYANVPLSAMDKEGNSFIYGYVPVVVAKCGVFIKETAETSGDPFSGGNAIRITQLYREFNRAPKYGRGLSWENYTVEDAGEILLRYLSSLPTTLIGALELEQWLGEDVARGSYLQSFITDVPEDAEGNIKQSLHRLIQHMIRPLDRQLLLYIVDMLAVLAYHRVDDGLTDIKLASHFATTILPSTEIDPTLPSTVMFRINFVAFLIRNADHLTLTR